MVVLAVPDDRVLAGRAGRLGDLEHVGLVEPWSGPGRRRTTLQVGHPLERPGSARRDPEQQVPDRDPGLVLDPDRDVRPSIAARSPGPVDLEVDEQLVVVAPAARGGPGLVGRLLALAAGLLGGRRPLVLVPRGVALALPAVGVDDQAGDPRQGVGQAQALGGRQDVEDRGQGVGVGATARRSRSPPAPSRPASPSSGRRYASTTGPRSGSRGATAAGGDRRGP